LSITLSAIVYSCSSCVVSVVEVTALIIPCAARIRRTTSNPTARYSSDGSIPNYKKLPWPP